MTNIRRALEAAAATGGDATYVEDVFSTYIYDGNSTSGRAITNGIDLAGEGGMVWFKQRDGSQNHTLFDTERGAEKQLFSNNDEAEDTYAESLKSFTSTGFTVGFGGVVNSNGNDYVSWAFRKAENFFTMVKFTADATFDIITHDLGSMPGMVIYKCVTSASDVTSGDWQCWHSAMGNNDSIVLNTTAAEVSSAGFIGDVTSTQCQFYCTSGETYIAYYFGNNQAVFGAGSDESIIKCGSFTPSGGNAVIDVGFEPQWVLIKPIGTTGNWILQDSMRHWLYNGNSRYLRPNLSNQEDDLGQYSLRNNGFIASGQSDVEYIYIAIRRPMKVPEAGTEVFSPDAYTGNSTAGRILAASAGFPLDLLVTQTRVGTGPLLYDRMRGNLRDLEINTTASGGASGTNVITSFNQAGFTAGDDTYSNAGYAYIAWMFKRASGFMDVLCYTGDDGSNRAVAHGLGVIPEMIIVKNRDASTDWACWSAGLSGTQYYIRPNGTQAEYNQTTGVFGTSAATATNFYVDDTGNTQITNDNGDSYLTLLFATVAGVSKVGSYTADATLTTINCGFSAGARFILIKRTDAAGDWYVYDSARGIVAGNDPYLLWNTNGAETTGTDYIDPDSSGFQITAAGSSTINVDTGEYIFLAIA